MNAPDLPDATAARSILAATLDQIRFARDYTLELLRATPEDLWYQIPDGLPTNVAWQAGHLAVAQYGLLLFRIRGREPSDLDLVPGRFRKAYAKQSTPSADASHQMTPSELIDRLTAVHEAGLREVQDVSAEVLLEPVDMPYAAYPIKLGAIMFCPLHEQIHAGQIGLLRRALGLDPIR